MWTKEMTRAYRVETERRFRKRTPPANDDIYSFDPGCRVVRSEMRTWAKETLGEYPPETDQEWMRLEVRWYRAMSRRVRKELGEED
jgi:hypothetical protein